MAVPQAPSETARAPPGGPADRWVWAAAGLAVASSAVAAPVAAIAASRRLAGCALGMDIGLPPRGRDGRLGQGRELGGRQPCAADCDWPGRPAAWSAAGQAGAQPC